MTSLVRYTDHWIAFAEALTGCKVEVWPGYGASYFTSHKYPHIVWDSEYGVAVLLHEMGHALDPACTPITKQLFKSGKRWHRYEPASTIFETEQRAWDIAEVVGSSVGVTVEEIRRRAKEGEMYYRRLVHGNNQ